MALGVVVLYWGMTRKPRLNPFLKHICDLASINSLTECAYCGSPATDREHVVPKSFRGNNDTVPSCRECNLLAGDNVFDSFGEKRDFIRQKVEYRYRELISAPVWTQGEIDELAGNLHAAMSVLEKARYITKARIRRLGGKA